MSLLRYAVLCICMMMLLNFRKRFLAGFGAEPHASTGGANVTSSCLLG